MVRAVDKADAMLTLSSALYNIGTSEAIYHFLDSKAEYTAESSTRSQKLKQTRQCPFNSVYRLRSVKSILQTSTVCIGYAGWLLVIPSAHVCRCCAVKQRSMSRPCL